MDSFANNKTDENETQYNENIQWTPEHEKILIEWADKAMCYRWLHSKANIMYSRLNAWYTIPVIVISTLTGTANFAQERVPLEYQSYYVMAVGAFNILAGIITTIQQFLKITQLNESHRVSGIAWDKFYRNIKIEISKHPQERIHVEHMIKMCKEEFDRLIETSPIIPDKIIAQFKANFSNVENDEIIKPEICDTLVPTKNFINPWNTTDIVEKNMEDVIKNKVIKENIIKKIDETNEQTVTDFKKIFYGLNNRDPLENEIIDNLKDKIELSKLTRIIQKQSVCESV
jgi:hypothetical protein